MDQPPYSPWHPKFSRNSLQTDSLRVNANWEDMNTFLQVAKIGSFAGVAQSTSKHHNTIKRSVDRLSDVLGLKLYIAKSNGIELTEQGIYLANRLAGVDDLLFDALQTTSSKSNGVDGTVRICLTDGLAAFWATPNLYDKLGAKRSIQLDFHSPISMTNFYENKSDILVSLMPMSGADIRCTRAGYLHLVPVASKGYVSQRGVPTLNNLSQHDFVQCAHYDARTSFWDPWTALLNQARAVDHADNFIVYAMQVKANAGVGLLGTYTILDPDAVVLNLGFSLRLGIYVSAIKDQLVIPHVKNVHDELLKIFGGDNPMFGEEPIFNPEPSRYCRRFQSIFNTDEPLSLT